MPPRKNKRSAPKSDSQKRKRSKLPEDTHNDIPSSPPVPPRTPATKKANVPVDWDPIDIAMWNATADGTDDWRPVHSSSPSARPQRSSAGVSLELFPELVEDSDEQDDCQDIDGQRGDESSPLKQSSPATSPPSAAPYGKRALSKQARRRPNKACDHEQEIEVEDTPSKRKVLRMTSTVDQRKEVESSEGGSEVKARCLKCSGWYATEELSALHGDLRFCVRCIELRRTQVKKGPADLEYHPPVRDKRDDAERLCPVDPSESCQDKAKKIWRPPYIDPAKHEEEVNRVLGKALGAGRRAPRDFYATWTRRSAIIRQINTPPRRDPPSPTGRSTDPPKHYPFTPPLPADQREVFKPSTTIQYDIEDAYNTMRITTLPNDRLWSSEGYHLLRERIETEWCR